MNENNSWPGGFIKVPRALCDHPLWTGERFDSIHALLDLAMRAGWPQHPIRTSLLALARDWGGWHRKTVRRFLEEGHRLGVITDLQVYRHARARAFVQITLHPDLLYALLGSSMAKTMEPPMAKTERIAIPREREPFNGDAESEMAKNPGVVMVKKGGVMAKRMAKAGPSPMAKNPGQNSSTPARHAPQPDPAMAKTTSPPMAKTMPPSSRLEEEQEKKPPPTSSRGGGSELLSASKSRIETGPERIGTSRAWADTMARLRSYAGEPEGNPDAEGPQETAAEKPNAKEDPMQDETQKPVPPPENESRPWDMNDRRWDVWSPTAWGQMSAFEQLRDLPPDREEVTP